MRAQEAKQTTEFGLGVAGTFVVYQPGISNDKYQGISALITELTAKYTYTKGAYMAKQKRTQVGAWSWNSEVLWSKIEKGEPDECWRYLGATGPHANLFGTKKNGKPQMSQLPRILYRDITKEDCEGMEITHTCENRYCCNPNHFMAIPLKSGRPPKAIEEKRKLQQGKLIPVSEWLREERE